MTRIKLFIILFLLIPFQSWATDAVGRPSANITTGFTATGAGCTSNGNYDCVDEVSTDDDTTYNTSSDTGGTAEDRFSFANMNIPTGSTISAVVLTLRIRDTGTGNNRIIHRLTHDSTYSGTDTALSTGYQDITSDFIASEAWQAADFDGQAVRIGYLAGGNGGTERRCTQAFLTVTYTAPSGGIFYVTSLNPDKHIRIK